MLAGMKHPVVAALLSVPLLLAVACQSSGGESTGGQPTSSSAAIDPAHYDQYGAGVKSADAVPVADVLAAPDKYVGKPVRVVGAISSVCQTKGCWMRLGGNPNVMVKFKDYGFFMPLDSAGREAIVEGELSVREIPVAEQRHYLEDAGKHAEAQKITAPTRQVSFMAAGVALKKRGA
jgi:hypothetical protein